MRFTFTDSSETEENVATLTDSVTVSPEAEPSETSDLVANSEQTGVQETERGHSPRP